MTWFDACHATITDVMLHIDPIILLIGQQYFHRTVLDYHYVNHWFITHSSFFDLASHSCSQ